MVPLNKVSSSSKCCRLVSLPKSVDIVPLKLVSSSSSRNKLVKPNICVGIVPVRVEPLTTKSLRLDNKPISVGIDPAIFMFSDSHKYSKDVNIPISDGIDPTKLSLLYRYISSILESCPNSVGIDPTKLFTSSISRYRRFSRSPSSDGSVPVRFVSSSSRCCRFFKSPSVVGMVPTRPKFHSKVRYSRLDSMPMIGGIVPCNSISSRRISVTALSTQLILSKSQKWTPG
mmetsp:Transcript_2527/g.3925  ORF Transcript_2527/g.3925 Transcript_2527/m.3925 type:complete len:229 (+) Transcript_2527:1373-2059(+)